MIDQPTISVLIPTHNRGTLASLVLQSVLNQTASNFEVVISDNSSNPHDSQLVQQAVNVAESRIPLRLVRPPRTLNMADHWEFATQHVRGKYIAMVTDHYALRPSAVQIWTNVLNELESDIVMSNVRSGFSGVSKTERTASFDGRIETQDASEVLGSFLRFDAWNTDSMLATQLPRSMNSLYRTDLIHNIRQRIGRVYWPLSPDYTSSFLLLANASDVTYIDRPFYCTFGDESNGTRCITHGTQDFVATFPGLDPFEGCPMRIESVQNTLYRDFLAMQQIDDKLAGFEIDIRGYYLSLYREILLKERLGSPLNTTVMRQRWQEHVDGLPPNDRGFIYENRQKLKGREVANKWFRRFLTAHKITPRVKLAKEYARGALAQIKEHPRYESVVDAVRETDHYLTGKIEGANLLVNQQASQD